MAGISRDVFVREAEAVGIAVDAAGALFERLRRERGAGAGARLGSGGFVSQAQSVGIDRDAAAALYERLRTLAKQGADVEAREPRGRSERKVASRRGEGSATLRHADPDDGQRDGRQQSRQTRFALPLLLAVVGGTLAIASVAFLPILDRLTEDDSPDWAGGVWFWLMVSSAACLALAAALAARSRVVVGVLVFLVVFVSVVFFLFLVVYAAANRDDDTPPSVTTVITPTVPGSRP